MKATTSESHDGEPTRPTTRGRGVRSEDLEYRDPAYIARINRILLAIGRRYFRADVRGLDNIPEGGVLLVGNHSGGFHIMDSFVFASEFYDHFGPERRFHPLIHDLIAYFPGWEITRKFGVLNAGRGTAEAALRKGGALLVYPGGDYETFRPSWHSNRIMFGGRKGFAKLALTENVPIVPVVAIGGQETALFLARGERLAKLFKLDRLLRLKSMSISLGFPFGLSVLDFPPRIPLPSKITIQVLPPIYPKARFGENATPEEVYDGVTADMQRALDALARERRFPVIG